MLLPLLMRVKRTLTFLLQLKMRAYLCLLGHYDDRVFIEQVNCEYS